jgi:hypothetical protein
MIANINNLLSLLGRARTELGYALREPDDRPLIDEHAVRGIVEEIDAMIVAPRNEDTSQVPVAETLNTPAERNIWRHTVDLRLGQGCSIGRAVQDADHHIEAIRERGALL